ncbi:hypothetical protein HPB48_026672 [Haemaphysalis longicornis]|uniref:Uncharacterized protein n=1 Tax=Haemaphysalis longicornis TaxID=44386 RepID=A0A9J6HCW5_HAELO|nr:hypothetical protein HPB48_026672 [Haemaphysalis longicornis]
MYAASAAALETAREQVHVMSHQEYVQRVATFLERKVKWLLLFHYDLLIRGHNTNNFAEASIRVLKRKVRHRSTGYDAVALVELVGYIWLSYFILRLLDHAYNRVPGRQLFCNKLLQRTPSDAGHMIRPLGDSNY